MIQYKAELWKVLNKLKKSMFIFLTTHYLEEAEALADRIGVLDEGRLIAFGTLNDLRKIVKYSYSVRILQKGVSVRPRHGNVITGENGLKQIVTTEQEADMLAKSILHKGRHKIFDEIPYPLKTDHYHGQEADRHRRGAGGGWLVMGANKLSQLYASVLINAVYSMKNYPITLVNTFMAPLSILVIITLISHGALSTSPFQAR